VSAIGSDLNHRASLEAARQSMILLKHDRESGLPFKAGRKLVVVGADVDDIAAIMEPGNYNANNICPPGGGGGGGVGSTGGERGIDTSCLSSVWQALNATNAAAGGSSALLARASGRGSGGWDSESVAAAVALAETADNLIVVISDANDEGGEGHDRPSIALAADQMRMAKAVFGAVAGKAGVRATLMMITGGVIGIDELREVAPSILDIKMPGVCE
jgi:hypothetical protein